MNTRVEISYRTILLTIAIVSGLWVLLQIKDILLLLLISFILMAALRPFVDWMELRKVPRAISIVLIYIVVFGIFGASLAGLLPSLILQVAELLKDLPIFIDRVLPYWDIDARSLTQQIAPLSENVVKVTVNVFSNIFQIFTVLVFTFYFLLERHHTKKLLINTFGEAVASQIGEIMREIEKKLGSWLVGQFFLMLFIGVLVYLTLLWLRIDFALPLAIIAGLLEVVPILGPFISGIPAVLVALTTSPFLALVVTAAYILIQQIENNIVVPVVMKKSVGLPPIVTIIALLIGGRFAGIVGVIMSVPVVVMLQITLQHLLKHRKS